MKANNGNVVRLRPCKDADTQKWYFNRHTGQMHNKLNSTYCLASKGGRSGDWVGLELWNCLDDSSQWLVSDEQHTISTASTTSATCVSLLEGIAKEGQILRLQNCLSGPTITQQWDRI